MTEALASVPSPSAPHETPGSPGPAQHASVAERVTLFEDRAEVVRSARVPVTGGPQWVQLAGITRYVDDRSVEVFATLPAKALSHRVIRRIVEEPAASASEVEELENTVREVRKRISACDLELARVNATAIRVDALASRWCALVAGQPHGLAEPAFSEELRGTYELARLERARTHEDTARLRAARQAAEDELESLGQRLANARLLHPREETLIEVQLDCPEPGEAALELRYRTPCALWRPEHLARLSWTGGAGGTVELTTFAVAWQATGERWEHVRVRFSTARPAREATPPLLTDDLLSLRKKSAEELKRVVVEARDQLIQTAGVAGARAVEEMPGVDDGGEPLNFEPSERVGLASDGRPFRVELARRTIPVQVSRVAYPERSGAPHLRATGTLPEGGPLLAGPVRIARQSALLGRSRVDFVAPGEPFELGFGPDDGLRVRRNVVEERDTVALVGTQKLKRKVTIFLSNLSGEARQVEVVERLPVSEVEGLDVSAAQPAEWKQDADGFAKQTVALAPGATSSLELSYEIRAASRVQLPF